MENDNLLNRINELAKKSKESTLTKSEKEEQQKLRKEYLGQFRKQVENQLSSIKVVDEEGNDVTPDKLKELKKKQNKDN